MGLSNFFINRFHMLLIIFILTFFYHDLLGKPSSPDSTDNQKYTNKKKVTDSGSITLILPTSGDSIFTGEQPYFAWQADSSISSSIQFYNLKIYEVLAGQTLNNAISKNKPYFEVDRISENYYQYPSSGPDFIKGNDYGWIIQAFDRNGLTIGSNNGTSSPATYRKGGNIIIHDTVNTELSTITPGIGRNVYRGQLPYFAWWIHIAKTDSTIQTPTYKLKIVEISNGELPNDALKSNKVFFEEDSINEQYFQYPASAPIFIEGNNYAWDIQALDKNGNPIGDNNGISGAAWFRKGGTIIPFDTVNELTLKSPALGETISSAKLPNFMWSLNFSNQVGGLRYKLTIAEILNNQSPIDAINQNKIFFEKEGITEQYFNYPSDAPNFSPNISYAWMIQLFDNNGNPVGNKNGESSIYWFKIEKSTGITSNDNLPNKINLEQNYPNPFNPVTTIQYEISKTTFVKISVYNILGKEVRVLKSEIHKPGHYSVDFDSNNLASGIYFYRMDAGNFFQTRKMILLK